LKQTYVLEVRDGSAWRKVAEGKTNGHGVKQVLPLVTAQTFRLTLTCNAGSPGVAELQLYRPE